MLLTEQISFFKKEKQNKTEQIRAAAATTPTQFSGLDSFSLSFHSGRPQRLPNQDRLPLLFIDARHY